MSAKPGRTPRHVFEEETVSNLGGRTKPVNHPDLDYPAFSVLRTTGRQDEWPEGPQV